MAILFNSLKTTLPFVVLFSLLLFWIYQSSARSAISPTSIDCKQSLVESDGYFCEPDFYWNERKSIFHIQDEINRIRTDHPYFYSTNWEPSFHCAHSQRVGAKGDGGKWICDMPRLKSRDDCLIYSVGSSGDFSFEIDMKKFMPHCEIHTFDKAVYTCPPNTCIFHQATFGDGIEPSNSKTWQTILQELNHTNRFMEILKIDIEGGEYKFFPQILKSEKSPLPRQILVELHPVNVTMIFDFFDQMREKNYAITLKENNNIGGAFFFEYGFIRLNQRFFD